MSAPGSVLVDTNVVVAYFRGDQALRPHFAGAAPLTYAVVLFPDHDTTASYAQVKAELAQLGRPIPDNDLWIAAMARHLDLPLATRDAHFVQVPRLKTLAW